MSPRRRLSALRAYRRCDVAHVIPRYERDASPLVWRRARACALVAPILGVEARDERRVLGGATPYQSVVRTTFLEMTCGERVAKGLVLRIAAAIRIGRGLCRRERALPQLFIMLRLAFVVEPRGLLLVKLPLQRFGFSVVGVLGFHLRRIRGAGVHAVEIVAFRTIRRSWRQPHWWLPQVRRLARRRRPRRASLSP